MLPDPNNYEFQLSNVDSVVPYSLTLPGQDPVQVINKEFVTISELIVPADGFTVEFEGFDQLGLGVIINDDLTLTLAPETTEWEMKLLGKPNNICYEFLCRVNGPHKVCMSIHPSGESVIV